MAREPVPKSYTSANSSELEIDIRTQEPIYKKLTEIFVENGETIGVHDNRTRVPLNSIVIKDDPTGALGAPAGTTLSFRGQASFGPVAVFRQTSAPAAEPAAPQVAPQAPVPPPTSAPVDDQGTGPEGNPNLNSDGTPRTIATNPASDEDG